jgi:NAD(P)-dependent dehydrogenase (short-subunit alcohol dehydrogenase family)
MLRSCCNRLAKPRKCHQPRTTAKGRIVETGSSRIRLLDSGIGRAVAIAFAREGCEIVFFYLNEHEDAEDTAN